MVLVIEQFKKKVCVHFKISVISFVNMFLFTLNLFTIKTFKKGESEFYFKFDKVHKRLYRLQFHIHQVIAIFSLGSPQKF